MNKNLREINELYLQIQDRYMDSNLNTWNNQTVQEPSEIRNNVDEYSRIYNIALKKFVELAPTLSPSEIVEGYEQGCRLLQRNLSGHMCRYFDISYVPIMIRAVQKKEAHTTPLFLQALANNLGNKIDTVVIDALDSEVAIIRETALSVAEQINLFKAIPKIQAMINDKDPNISSLANQIIQAWKNKTNH